MNTEILNDCIENFQSIRNLRVWRRKSSHNLIEFSFHLRPICKNMAKMVLVFLWHAASLNFEETNNWDENYWKASLPVDIGRAKFMKETGIRFQIILLLSCSVHDGYARENYRGNSHLSERVIISKTILLCHKACVVFVNFGWGCWSVILIEGRRSVKTAIIPLFRLTKSHFSWYESK